MKRPISVIALVGTAAAAAFGVATSHPAEAASTNKYAHVNAAGGVVASNGVTSAVRLGVGQYEVTFASNVSACAYVSTTDFNAAQSVQSYTAGGHSSVNGVYVEVKNQGGGLTDLGFSLAVNCGGTGQAYAVIGYANQLVRGSGGAAVTNLGPGRYSVHFASNVAGCAYLATVGDPANALIFSPSGVYTGTSTTAGDVYIETKNPGGGLQSGVPFHLSVLCANAPTTRIAVVGSNGLSVGQSAGTSAFRSALGKYQIVTNRAINTCATIVTRGSTNTAVPFNPDTVESSAGPATNVATVTVRKILSLGGTAIDDATHVGIIC